ncbi:hypothetical protein Godav_014212, partial [Gossypium davidsonii]|nr:hypothetical protein [Gossypium davidsonii]
MKYLSTPFIDRTILTNSSLTEEVITSLREAAARVLGPYPPPGPDFPPPPTPVGYSRTHRSPSPPQPGYQGYCYEGYPSSSPGLLPPRLPPRNEYTHNVWLLFVAAAYWRTASFNHYLSGLIILGYDYCQPVEWGMSVPDINQWKQPLSLTTGTHVLVSRKPTAANMDIQKKKEFKKHEITEDLFSIQLKYYATKERILKQS